MNKMKKIGLTALAASLVSVSAQAVDISGAQLVLVLLVLSMIEHQMLMKNHGILVIHQTKVTVQETCGTTLTH